jgi:hypothetical protein
MEYDGLFLGQTLCVTNSQDLSARWFEDEGAMGCFVISGSILWLQQHRLFGQDLMTTGLDLLR